MTRRAVFLDRDGTINAKPSDGEYVTSVDGLAYLPGALDAIRDLTRAGFALFVVTNQRGIALGTMTEDDLAAIHERLTSDVRAAGGAIERIYHCPHDLDSCDCRKPAPGLLLRAVREFPWLELADAWVVGDSAADVEAAAAVGARSVLLAGPGSTEAAERGAARLPVAASLAEAVELIVVSKFLQGVQKRAKK